MDKKIDLHIHSNWSLDSSLSMKDAISEATHKNCSIISFTEHLDVGFPFLYSPVINIPSHIFSIKKFLPSTPLQILTGIETGITEANLKETEGIVKHYPFDLIIASAHCNNEVSFCSIEARKKYGDKLVEAYLKHVLFIIKNYSAFHTLAHFDYLLRYHPISNKKFLSHTSLIDEILGNIIEKNKSIEINTKGYATLFHTHPQNLFIQRYRNLGGTRVTFGSDAHSVGSVGLHYSDAKKVLRESNIYHFSYPTRNGWEYFIEKE